MTDPSPPSDPTGDPGGRGTGPGPAGDRPTDPTAPYGAGWADDGGYLPPPGPTGPEPGAAGQPAGWGAPTGGGPPPGGEGQGGYAPPGGHAPQGGYGQGGYGQGGYSQGGYGQGGFAPPGGYGGGLPPAPFPGMTPLGWVTTPWGPRWRGPIGEARATGTTILLSIVTCGIWTYVWSFQNHEELKRYRGEGLGGAMGLVLAILVSPAVMFTIPAEIERMYQEEGLPSPVTTTIGLWFLLPIIGNFIWYFAVQNALNDFWVARGALPA